MGGTRDGSETIINGKITVGSTGANTLDLSANPVIGGKGTIQQTGKADVTRFGSGGTAGQHLDIRAGKLEIGDTYNSFRATIGPASGSGASLGPTAEVQFYPQSFRASEVTSATFDTAHGLLSLMNATGVDLDDFHFSGNAHGLNLSAQVGPSFGYMSNGTYVSITDHPGTASMIPIKFS